MSRFRRFEIIESSPSSFLRHTSISTPQTLTFNPFSPSFAVVEDDFDFALDLLAPKPFPSPCHELEATITDLLQIETTAPLHRRIQRRLESRVHTESYLQSLCDRVSDLELSFDRLVKAKAHGGGGGGGGGDRRYTWTAEIESPEKDGFDRKYKWTAEIKGAAKKKDVEPKAEKTYKWTAEIKGRGEESPITKTYTFKTSTGKSVECSGLEKKETKEKKDKKKKEVASSRIVEIEEPNDHGSIVLRQAFARRVEKRRGKRKELSPQDAAMMIQMSFKAYLIRRSQALRALRELAIAKTKLKELRAMFNNFSYRRRVARDAEERQKFSERIIVLLLTVDAIEGADLMVRSSKRSMVDELEAMLDVVDPQPPGKSLSMRRRTFDMPDGVLQKELAESVAQVVKMLDEE